MATALAVSGQPVYYGGSTVHVGDGTVKDYEPLDRVLEFTNINSLNVAEVTNAKYRSGKWLHQQGSIPASQGDVNQGSGVDAVVYYPAVPYASHTLRGLVWDYNAVPTSVAAALQIESPSGTIIWGPVAVQTQGDGFFDFHHGVRAKAGSDCLVRLTDGGIGIIGTVGVKGHLLE